MKNFFVLSMLISFALICSCQKQTSTGEQQQLAQRQAELDAREKALGENENAITPKATVPPKLQGLIADPGRGDETEQIIQQRLAQRQRKMEELRARRMEHAVVRPGEETPSPTPSPTPK